MIDELVVPEVVFAPGTRPRPGYVWKGPQRFTKVLMTPEWATDLMSRNSNNRVLRETWVRDLCSDRRDGRWMCTHEGVCIDTEGNLVDAQHRLTMIIRTGLSTEIWLAEGFDPSIRDVVNVGRSRTAADLITMSGQREYSTVIASMARCVLLYDHHAYKVWSSSIGFSKPELVAYERQHQDEFLSAAQLAQRFNARVPLFTVTSAGVVIYLIARDTDHGDRFEEFYTGVISGAGLGSGDSRLALRNRSKQQEGSPTWRLQSAVACGIKAWNAFLSHRPVENLRFQRNNMPMPKVL